MHEWEWEIAAYERERNIMQDCGNAIMLIWNNFGAKRTEYCFIEALCQEWDSNSSQSVCVLTISPNMKDRLSPIKKMWKIFIKNCTRYYEAIECCTEQLFGFRGRCIFKMFIKSKPDKYGLKLVTLNDARTFYLVIFLLHKYKKL